MPRRNLIARLLLTITAVASVVVATSSGVVASNAPIELRFQKDCPVLTCDGWLVAANGTQIAGTATHDEIPFSSLRFSDNVLHYSLTGSMTGPGSSITIAADGILNYNISPNLTVLDGTVTSGTWDGRALGGARIHIVAERLSGYDGHTFGGTLTILPAS